MRLKTIVISEAKMSSSVALASTPLLLAIAIAFAEALGEGLGAGIYFRAFGPIVYFLFFGGLAYAFYEFTKIVRGRSQYLTYRDGHLRILEQRSVKLDDVCSLTIERRLLWDSLVIKTARGTTSRIHGYLLQKDLTEVKDLIETLRISNHR